MAEGQAIETAGVPAHVEVDFRWYLWMRRPDGRERGFPQVFVCGPATAKATNRYWIDMEESREETFWQQLKTTLEAGRK